MTITITELFDKLKDLDELSVLELLDLDSEAIVEHFKDEIEDKFDTLVSKFDEEDYTQDMGGEKAGN